MEILALTVGDIFGLKSPKGRFGIEIELEGENLPAGLMTEAWVAKVDGSLRNGMEYVSRPTNTPRDDVIALKAALDANGVIIRPSYRCSTHIHYNFINKTWAHVIGTIIAWNILEPLFLKQMPPGRDGSIFCMSAYDTGDLPVHFHTFCEELHRKFRNHGIQGVCRQKYASLNLTRLGDLGTLEFRIFPPSVEGVEIKRWCNWLDNLINFVEKIPADEFGDFVTTVEKNPVGFVTEIFGELPVPADQIGAWVDLGCKTAYELVRIFNASCKKKYRAKPKKEAMNVGLADLQAGEVFINAIVRNEEDWL